MAVTNLSSFDDQDPTDVLFKQRAERAHRADPKDAYKSAPVVVKIGDTSRKVILRWPERGTFVFAVYGENPDWHDEDRRVWQAAASDALGKFCAIRNVLAKHRPMEEFGNAYNMFVETQGRIE